MNVIPSRPGGCGWARGDLDAYLDGELQAVRRAEVLGHLVGCGRCARSLEDRARARHLLRRAVGADGAPASLRDAVRRRVREGGFGITQPGRGI
jgi:anti-sigma factor (TIGR02949 family)